ncbi:MAG: PD-(D/E)XK nuclease family protein, partial [Tepidisphaerales bacterium]
PEDLEKLAGEAGGIFAAKLADLALLYRAYNDFLGQERLDPRRRIAAILERMKEAGCLRGATVFVDGYSEFSDPERRMLARLGRLCERVEVTLLLDAETTIGSDTPPDELGVLHRVEYTCQKLLKACADEGTPIDKAVLMKEIRRYATDELRRVEARMAGKQAARQNGACGSRSAADPHPNPLPEGEGVSDTHSKPLPRGERAAKSENLPGPLWKYAKPDVKPVPRSPTDAVCFVQAGDRRQEVEHAAGHIRKLLSRGMRLRDIAVLVRSLDNYHDLISAAFTEHGIPFFADRRRTMAHHPLVQLIRAAFAVAARTWPHEAVMTLIKTGLAGLGGDETDTLENYVLQHRLRGRVWIMPEPWEWKHRPNEAADERAVEEETAAVDAMRRRIADPLKEFAVQAKTPLPLRRRVEALFVLIEKLGARQQLGQWIDAARSAEQHELAGEHEQAWEKVCELFDQLIELMGDEPATMEDFARIAEAGLEEFDLALAPPTVDQVLVGQVDRTATGDVKAALVLGLNEGVFPRIWHDESILSDAERLELRRRDFEVDPATERLTLDERFWGYIALTRASHHLCLSRVTADDAGRPDAPSVFWDELRALFPDAPLVELPRSGMTLPAITSARRLVTAVAQWVRSGEEPKAGSPWPALYQCLAANRASLPEHIDRLVKQAWPALAYANDASLAASTAAALFASPLSATPRRIEIYATCPYKHFAEYGLGLGERDESPLAEVNLDKAYHSALELLVREMLTRRQDWQQFSDKRAGQIVAGLAERVAEELGGELMLGAGRNEYLLRRVEETIERILGAQRAAADRGELTTRLAAIAYGPPPAILPPVELETPRNRKLELRGRIDRLDVLGKDAAFAVFDYQLKDSKLDLWRVREGLSLQLIVSLLAIKTHAKSLSSGPMVPAAALYVRLLDELAKVSHPSEAPAPKSTEFYLPEPRRGVFDERHFREFDDQTPAGAWSPVVKARLKQDGGLGNKRITDHVSAGEVNPLLELARTVVAELADRIMDGEILVRPYKLGTSTPCKWCAYKSVCRFDPAINPCRKLEPVARDRFLDELMGRPAGGTP